MTDPIPAARTRRKLRHMEHDDAREVAKSTPEAMERNLRATLNAAHPNASPEEIERLIVFIKLKWSKPTTSVVKRSPVIPKRVLDARRAERKATVAKGREARRDS